MNMYARPMPPDDFRQTDPRLAEYDPPDPPGLTWPEAFNVLTKVRDSLCWVIARFWSPGAFGALTSIMRSQQRELLTWLRPLELILRRLFLIEAHALAATLHAPSPRTPPRAPTTATTERRAKETTADPLTWSAPFSTHVSATAPSASDADDAPRSHSYTPAFRLRPKDEDAIAARPLALRVEALLRAVIDPMRCIRRLARQLQRRGAPAFARLTAPEPCEIPSLKRTLALVTDTAAPLFLLRTDSS